MLPTFCGERQQLTALLPRGPKKRKGMCKIACGQPRFFRKSLGSEIVGISPRGNLSDLDQSLADTSLQVGIGQPQRDAKLARNRALRHRRVSLDRVEHPEHNCIFGQAAVWFGAGHRHGAGLPGGWRQALVRVPHWLPEYQGYLVHRVNVNLWRVGRPPAPVWARHSG